MAVGPRKKSSGARKDRVARDESCSLCEGKHHSLGLCKYHYHKQYRELRKNPDWKPQPKFSDEERLFEGSTVDIKTGCINHGFHYRDAAGHTNVYWRGEYIPAHRAVWLMHYGDIPDKMVVRHFCHNAACINIAHLKLGTPADNNRDRDFQVQKALVLSEAILRYGLDRLQIVWNNEMFVHDTYLDGKLLWS